MMHFTDAHATIEDALHIEVAINFDMGISPHLEAQISTMATQLQKLSIQSTPNVQIGLWCTNYEVNGHNK